VPELPDIEIFKRYVDATSLHQKISDVKVRNEKVLGAVSARKLQSTMKGRTFQSTRRHGKNQFVKLDDGGWMLGKKERDARAATDRSRSSRPQKEPPTSTPPANRKEPDNPNHREHLTSEAGTVAHFHR